MILLIDGRSGSGKTELAAAITEGIDVQCVHLDALYPGWGGLAEGSAAVVRLLTEHRWQRWDWERGVAAEWHEVDPDRPLVIEGCGAITAESAALADHTVWVEYPDAGRRERALNREPEFAAHWDAWAAQEREHIARNRPLQLAHELVNGADVQPSAERWRALLAG